MSAKLIEKSYLIFLLLLPLVHFSITIDPVLMPRQVYLSTFVLWIIYPLFSEKDFGYLPLKNPLYLAISSYILLAFVSAYTNGFNSESHYVLSKQLVVFSFLLVTIHALYNKVIDISVLIKGCIGIGIIAIAGAYFHWIEKTIDGEKLLARPGLIRSFFANKNLLASILFMCLPFFLMGLKQSKKIRNLSIIGLISALPILLLLGTRSVFMALGVFGLIISIYHLKNRYSIRKRMVGLASLIVLVLAVVVYKKTVSEDTGRNHVSGNAASQYFEKITNNKTLVSRGKFWDNSIAMWQEQPLLGVGLGNWQVEFPKYGLNKFQEYSIANGIDTLQRPHNDFLNILCENGLLGLVAYLLIFGIVYYQLFYLIEKTTATEKWRYIFILAGISGYIIISFFDFPMERIEHQVLLMLFFAITTSHFYLQKGIETPAPKQIVLKYCLAALSFYALILAGFRFKGEADTVKMYAAKTNEQWDQMLYHARKAKSYFYTIDATSIPIDWYEGLAHFNRGEIDQSVTDFESAYAKAPYQIQVLNNLAGSYENSGKREKAIAYYQKALQISGTFEEAILNLAAVYYNEKQYEKAFDYIDQISPKTSNKKYKLFLAPILQKKINIIMVKNNDLELNKKLAQKITLSQHILRLYWGSKRDKISFEAMVLSMKHKDIEL